MNNSKRGFTFIEMIVVITVLGLALPSLFAIVFSILQQQTKIIRLSEIKRQGDNIIDVMSTAVRSNALEIYSDFGLTSKVCATASSSYPSSGTVTELSFKDRDSKKFGYYLSGSAIAARTDASYISGNLTSSKIVVQNFSISCKKSAQYASPVVTVQFEICYKRDASDNSCSATRSDEFAKLTYNTKIKLRNQ